MSPYQLILLLFFFFPLVDAIRSELLVDRWVSKQIKTVKHAKAGRTLFAKVWDTLRRDKNRKRRRAAFAVLQHFGCEEKRLRAPYGSMADATFVAEKKLNGMLRAGAFLSRDERERSLAILLDFANYDTHSAIKDLPLRRAMVRTAMQASLRMVEYHYEEQHLTDRGLTNLIEYMASNITLDYATPDYATIDDSDYDEDVIYEFEPIVVHRYAVPFLVDMLRYFPEAASASRSASDLLYELFVSATDAERTAVLILYFPLMNDILMYMDMNYLSALAAEAVYAGIMLECSPLLARIAAVINCPYDGARPEAFMRGLDRHWEGARAAVRIEKGFRAAFNLLTAAVGSDAKLEELLALGFLSAARYYVREDGSSWLAHNPSPHVIFNQVLTMHPEWCPYFRQLTKDGPPDNRTAQLGRSLVARHRPSATYTLNKETGDF